MMGRPRKPRETLVCRTCGKEFTLPSHMVQRRLRQMARRGEPDKGLFCGKVCAGMGRFHMSPLVQRPWMSDDQAFWEGVLQSEGLSMGRGLTRYLCYGHDGSIWSDDMLREEAHDRC